MLNFLQNDLLSSLVLIIIFVPTISSISIGLFGRFFGVIGCAFVSSFTLFFLFIINLFILYFVLCGEIHELMLTEWVSVSFGFDWIFIVDILNIEMCFIILLISLCVIVYSVEYMSHDPHLPRFLCYLLLFTVFMLFLVLSGNLVQLFIGWEGVGLVSYLLVNFWFTRLEANRSAIKAVLFNRVGDFGYVLALVLVFYYFKTADFCVLFLVCEFGGWTNVFVLELICFFLFLGAMGKSAQLGLHAWLPDAMEGPTPVSALLHSATMVTAGVFVLLRCAPIFSYCTYVLSFISIIGAITSLFSGTIAVFQNDLKKIIAYSTCSQLGFMVASFGLCNFNGCFFHLINHAFFKALLFLAAGSVIHGLMDEQDLRKMGGLFYYMPLTAVCMLIGFLGLSGFPFLAGYYSKEQILFNSLFGIHFHSSIVFFMLLASSVCTALYSCRVLFLVFYSNYRGFRPHLFSLVEPGFFMFFSIVLLTLFTIFGGFVNEDVFLGLSNTVWDGIFFYNNTEYLFFNIYKESASFFIRVILVFIYMFFYFFFFYFYTKNNFFFNFVYIERAVIFKTIYVFLNEKWWFNSVYKMVSDFYLKTSYLVLFRLLDRGVFEKFGPTGLARLVYISSQIVVYIQNGKLNTYFLVFIGVFLLILSIFVSYIFTSFIYFCYIIFFILFDLLIYNLRQGAFKQSAEK